MARKTIEIPEEWKEKIEEYMDYRDWEDEAKAIRDMMAHGYVFGFVKPKFTEVQEEINELEKTLEKIKSGELNAADGLKDSTEDRLEELRGEKDKLVRMMDWKYHETLRSPQIKSCPICGEEKEDLKSLAMHIDRKGDEHREWMEEENLESETDVREFFEELSDFRELLEGTSLRPEISSES